MIRDWAGMWGLHFSHTGRWTWKVLTTRFPNKNNTGTFVERMNEIIPTTTKSQQDKVAYVNNSLEDYRLVMLLY